MNDPNSSGSYEPMPEDFDTADVVASVPIAYDPTPAEVDPGSDSYVEADPFARPPHGRHREES